MDWLKPNVTRMGQYYAALNDSRNAYVHIPNDHVTHKFTCGAISCHDTEDLEHAYRAELAKYRTVSEYRSKIQPVSVIVSDKSQVPSTSPSASENNNSSNENENYSGTDETNNTAAGTTSPAKKSKCEYTYKPVPMVRKCRRRFICAEQKDESYWERRRRNNEAAKKSREQRREKEIEVNRKCNALEKENSGLKFTVVNLQERNKQMETTIQMYKELLFKNNLL